ncbi:MAG: molybdopterin oxidoreductase [Planctomycetota bacterium]|nr:MAG: molybdopterin oxidoreductase [Planctomycetota bacterium]
MSSLPIVNIAPISASGEAAGSAEEFSLVQMLLREQQDLSAVERFAREGATSAAPAAEKYYRALMPAAAPGPGQQYGFEVDLDRCSGCKACVTACHGLNGLDEGETWRDVGLLVGGTRSAPVMQHVTTACHHCVSPACMIACPVNAYEKDPQTGIVKHLDDQCFGCQYCTMACPYDVPKYHAGKGIVRKCDMCSTRLAADEAPACVQACPHQAISIQLVDVQQTVEDAEATNFLPAAPDPQITYPTTTYRTRRVFPRNMLPVDYFQVGPQHPHWPLVVMLVLTQLSVGAFAVGLVLEGAVTGSPAAPMRQLHGLTALVFGLVALAASTFHLGRPQYAYRAILGLRHSWMSREILAFGVFAGLACVYAAALVLLPPGASPMPTWLGGAVVAVGAVGVFGSVMIYATLGREFWSFPRTTLRFLLTAGLLGTATAWLSVVLFALAEPDPDAEQVLASAGRLLCPALILLASAKLLWEASLLRHLLSRSMTQLKRSAMLMTGELSNYTLARFATGLAGGVFVPAILLAKVQSAEGPLDSFGVAVLTAVLFAACLAGEILERYLFFAAVAAPRMPGGIR